MSTFGAFLASSAPVTNLHHGAVLPAARFVVIAVPCLAALFYVLVVRRNRSR